MLSRIIFRSSLKLKLKEFSTISFSFYEERSGDTIKVNAEKGKKVLDIALDNNVDIEGLFLILSISLSLFLYVIFFLFRYIFQYFYLDNLSIFMISISFILCYYHIILKYICRCMWW